MSPEGVWFAEIAPLTNPALVPQAVAAAMGIPEQVGHSLLRTLIRALRGRAVLLVMDNCEHPLVACARLVEVGLRGSPGLRILTTSREPLGIDGERVWHVPPLELPARLAQSKKRHVVECAAVQLFVDRAYAARADFQLPT